MDYRNFGPSNKNQSWEENAWNDFRSKSTAFLNGSHFSQNIQNQQFESTSHSSGGVRQQNESFTSLPADFGFAGPYRLNSCYYNSRHSVPSYSQNSPQYPAIGSTSFDSHPMIEQSLHADQPLVVSTCDDSPQEYSQKRAVFSKFQLEALELKFLKKSYLSRDERQDLAGKLNLTDRQIMIWFQNRRSRLKKRGMADAAYHTKQHQNQEFMEQLKNNERVFPVHERTLQRETPF